MLRFLLAALPSFVFISSTPLFACPSIWTYFWRDIFDNLLSSSAWSQLAFAFYYVLFFSFCLLFFPFICFLLSCCCVKLCSSFLLLLSIFYLFVFCALVVVSFQHTFPQHTEIQRILFATLQLGISAVHFYIFCWWFWFLFFFDCILYNSFWFYVFLWFMLFSILRFESIAFS